METAKMKRGLLLFVEKRKGGRSMEKYIVQFDNEHDLVSVKDLVSDKTMLCHVPETRCNDSYDAMVYAMKYLNNLNKKPALNCKVICVDSGTNHCFTTGKVYPIINGALLSDHGFGIADRKYNSLREFLMSMEVYEDNPCGLKFIEYKGEATVKEDK